MLNQFADALKSVAVIVSFFIVLALISIVGSHVIWPTPTIESVAVPSSVQSWGYTPDAFVQRVSDGTHEIALNARRDFDEAYPRRWIDIQTIEAKIPGSDFTTRSAAQFISDIFGRPSGRITGFVTKVDNVFEISLRVVGGSISLRKSHRPTIAPTPKQSSRLVRNLQCSWLTRTCSRPAYTKDR